MRAGWEPGPPSRGTGQRIRQRLRTLEECAVDGCFRLRWSGQPLARADHSLTAASMRRFLPHATAALLLTAPDLIGAQVQAPVSSGTAPAPRTAAARKRTVASRTLGKIIIDGALDDASWQAAAVATDFVQSEPLRSRRRSASCSTPSSSTSVRTCTTPIRHTSSSTTSARIFVKRIRTTSRCCSTPSATVATAMSSRPT